MAKKFKKPHAFHLPSTSDKVEKFINYLMLDGKKIQQEKYLKIRLLKSRKMDM